MEVNAVITGATAAAAVTGLFTMVGHFLQKSTSVNASRMDDRGKFTRDLMETVDSLTKNLEAAEIRIKKTELREMTVLRLVNNVAMEVVIFTDHLDAISSAMDSDPPDYKYTRTRLNLMKVSIKKLEHIVNYAEDDMIGIIPRANKDPEGE